MLQQQAGNRAVQRLMQRAQTAPEVGPEGGDLGASLQSQVEQARGGGRAVEPGAAGQIGRTLGADVSSARVHTDASADQINQSLGSEAATLGRDIFFRQGAYNPGSADGRKLLAHELTHVVQQGAAGNSKNGPVQHKMQANRLSLKRVKMHLDFVRMKRKKAHIGKKIEETLGLGPGVRDAYGHWWTELGRLDGGDAWHPETSYGWWPSQRVNVKQTLKGVPGVLNKGQANDPHHGHAGDEEFHPVMSVDDQADYDQVRQQVSAQIKSFSTGFKGSWNWRFGWGKNCHTFQQRMKTKLHLHKQHSNRWLRDPQALAQKKQAQDERDRQEQKRLAKERAMHADPKTWVTASFMDFYADPERKQKLGMLRAGEKVGPTGVVQGDMVQFAMGAPGSYRWYWSIRHEYEQQTNTAYPANEETEESSSGAQSMEEEMPGVHVDDTESSEQSTVSTQTMEPETL